MSKAVREHIVRFTKEELIGPATSLSLHDYEEGFDIPFREKPRSRYGAGILFPQKAQTQTQEEIVPDDTDVAGAEQPSESETVFKPDSDRPGIADLTDQTPENDYEITLANEFLPSAMGITALVDVSADLLMRVTGAWYKQDKGAESSGGVNRSWRISFFRHDGNTER